jgi:DNA modification methylase
VEPYFADADVTLYCGDCLPILSGLPDQSVDAIVTSPPYLDVRSDVATYADAHEYLEWLDAWLVALARVLNPTGSLMLNIGRLHRDGVEVPFADNVRRRASQGGWKLLDTMVWHKVNGGGGRKTPYLLDRHEYVFWLALETDPYKGFDEARVPYAPETLARYKRRWRAHGGAVKGKVSPAQDGREAHPDGALPGSVFTSSVGVEKGLKHPTPMSIDLAQQLVRLACPPGALVLDPFAGSGTTGRACRLLGRRAVLIELDEGHCEEAARTLAQQTLLAPL